MALENLLNGLRLTVIAMGIVFVSLWLLSLVMSAMRPIFYREPKPKQATPAAARGEARVETPVNQHDGLSPQLVAVIATAVAAYLGQTPDNLNIISIRQAPTAMTQWSMTARRESIQN